MTLHTGRSGRWVMVFAVVCLVSAMGLVNSTHRCRIQYAQLQQLELQRWALQEDYSRLLLQHSTLAAPHRVDELARESLKMTPPSFERYRVVGR